MLTVEQRFMIQDLYRKGVSISEIARRTGHDRKTIRQLVSEPLVPIRPPRARRPHKLDPYAAYLEQRIADGVLNAHKLFGEIQRQGYAGGESQVKAFVHARRPTTTAGAVIRFETDPGQQAQVDWGHFGDMLHHGRRQRLYAFLMTLGWSRVMFLHFTVATDILTFLRCHILAFQYFGGMPREMLHDNLKTAVLGRRADGTVQFHPRYLDFAGYYGFTPRACQPYRAQTKGKVERGMRYVRGNFWPGLRYSTLDDLNSQAQVWLDTVANVRVHATTGVVPFSRLGAEGLQHLADRPVYDTSEVVTRHSTRDGLVSYDGNLYSVPAALAGQALVLKITPQDELYVLTSTGSVVAQHRRSYGRHERCIDPSHMQDLLPTTVRPRRRGGAMQVPSPSVESVLQATAPEVETRPLTIYDDILEVLA